MNNSIDIRKGICPQCGHNEIIEAAQAEFGADDRTYQKCVTYDTRWVFPGQNPAKGHGPLYLYVCRACGFCQWYAKNPERIPISEGHQTRLIEGKQPETGIRKEGE